MPPPLLPEVLSVMVTCTRSAVPMFQMAPPLVLASLPLMVALTSVRAPDAVFSMVPDETVVLPEINELRITSSPAFEIAPPLVDVVTQNPGQSAEEIERYITIPIEIQMAGIPNVTAVRTISLFGLSDVKVQFTYAFTYDEAQQWVINRLSQLAPLPNGATPQISPDSPIGEIYRYRVVGPPGFSVTDLKTIQNWILERRFKAVPGVIDVTG